MVVPPSDLRDQEEEPVKTVEEKPPEPPTLKIPFIKQPVPRPSTEVVVVAATTAVTAVAATTITSVEGGGTGGLINGIFKVGGSTFSSVLTGLAS